MLTADKINSLTAANLLSSIIQPTRLFFDVQELISSENLVVAAPKLQYHLAASRHHAATHFSGQALFSPAEDISDIFGPLRHREYSSACSSILSSQKKSSPHHRNNNATTDQQKNNIHLKCSIQSFSFFFPSRSMFDPKSTYLS